MSITTHRIFENLGLSQYIIIFKYLNAVNFHFLILANTNGYVKIVLNNKDITWCLYDVLMSHDSFTLLLHYYYKININVYEYGVL